MYTKVVLRLLDAAGALLGWTEVQALMRGDGALWAERAVSIVVGRSGQPHQLSVHWADLNVEVRSPCHTIPEVAVGQVVEFPAGVLMQIGTPPANLPPVTVGRSISIDVPVGNLAAKGGG